MDKMTATAKSHVNLGIQHLFAASRLAKRVSEVEAQYMGYQCGEFWEEIFQNSLGVATLSVASMESYANELYFEGATLAPSLNEAAASQIKELIDRESILRKFSVALAIRSGNKLDFSISPVQNAEALIKLRNGIVHFRPEWFGEQKAHDRLSRLLQNKFAPSPFLLGEPLFPRAWASGEFVAWALRSTVTFLDHFYNEAAMENPITDFKARIGKLSGVAL